MSNKKLKSNRPKREKENLLNMKPKILLMFVPNYFEIDRINNNPSFRFIGIISSKLNVEAC